MILRRCLDSNTENCLASNRATLLPRGKVINTYSPGLGGTVVEVVHTVQVHVLHMPAQHNILFFWTLYLFPNILKALGQGSKRHRIPDPDPQHWSHLLISYLYSTVPYVHTVPYRYVHTVPYRYVHTVQYRYVHTVPYVPKSRWEVILLDNEWITTVRYHIVPSSSTARVQDCKARSMLSHPPSCWKRLSDKLCLSFCSAYNE